MLSGFLHGEKRHKHKQSDSAFCLLPPVISCQFTPHTSHTAMRKHPLFYIPSCVSVCILLARLLISFLSTRVPIKEFSAGVFVVLWWQNRWASEQLGDRKVTWDGLKVVKHRCTINEWPNSIWHLSNENKISRISVTERSNRIHSTVIAVSPFHLDINFCGMDLRSEQSVMIDWGTLTEITFYLPA